jgi:hypothetical protein
MVVGILLVVEKVGDEKCAAVEKVRNDIGE